MDKPISSCPSYDYSRFTWSHGLGVADASDLGIPAGAEPGDRVWSDSCDVGFIVRGERDEKVFTLRSAGDGAKWIFMSEDRKHTIIVWND